MNRLTPLLIAAVLCSSCSDSRRQEASNENPASAPDGAYGGDAQTTGGRWDLQSSDEGVALALLGQGDSTVVRLFCSSDSGGLLVNVPGFRAVGSEERMSAGSDGDVVVLVADSRGDHRRGGVTGKGPVPDNLAQLISGQFSVNYGSQDSGPHPAPPAQAARAFAAACQEPSDASRTNTPPLPNPAGPPPANAASACHSQQGRPVPAIRLRAVGTEPFWGARIDGRCVTYSHPENQAGTRVWTQFSGSGTSGTWTGFYENKRFVLRTRPEPRCSDGMSDHRYPVAVSLEVAGEQRSGCAEPL